MSLPLPKDDRAIGADIRRDAKILFDFHSAAAPFPGARLLLYVCRYGPRHLT